MKKQLIIIIMLLTLTGCQSVNDLTIEDTLHLYDTNSTYTNIIRIGYKYFLPRGLQIEDSTLYNEVLSNNKYKFYLYTDVISYINKKPNTYQEKDTYYSKKSTINEKISYLEINNLQNDQYLIEIMYNYAKIEVMVIEEDIEESLIYAINVLKSIKYNDSVIEKSFTGDFLNSNDEEYNIFETIKEEDIFLNFEEQLEE